GIYHSQINEAWFVNTPGMIVILPSTPYDAKGLLKSAIRSDDPVIFFEHKRLYRTIKEELPEDDFTVPIGKADIKRDGKDVTLITYGYMMHHCLKAAEILFSEGIDAEVLDLRTLLPYDKEAILESVKKTSRAAVVHESPKTGGVGGEISAFITENIFEYLDAPVTRICGLDVPPIPFAPPMEHFYLPNPDKIADAVRELMTY
ncbi:MAG: alpha-ketoacid dehydrogenase subunit beta, partial [candidate division Zixibacteria bacterium CG_4_9_14_3_um_filter_46_8]